MDVAPTAWEQPLLWTSLAMELWTYIFINSGLLDWPGNCDAPIIQPQNALVMYICYPNLLSHGQDLISWPSPFASCDLPYHISSRYVSVALSALSVSYFSSYWGSLWAHCTTTSSWSIAFCLGLCPMTRYLPKQLPMPSMASVCWLAKFQCCLQCLTQSIFSQHFSTCTQLTKTLGSKHPAVDWLLVVYYSSVNFTTISTKLWASTASQSIWLSLTRAYFLISSS